jgi:hypothetical protein
VQFDPAGAAYSGKLFGDMTLVHVIEFEVNQRSDLHNKFNEPIIGTPNP